MKNKVVAVAPHVMLAKSRNRITVAAEETLYYAQVGRDITPTNIHWKTLTNFDIQWDALRDLKKQDDPEVPKLTKNGSVIRWIDYFKLHLNAIVGIRNCLLVYIMREKHEFSGVNCDTLICYQPHSKEHVLVEVEMISFISHGHPLFRNYNRSVYYRMERALSGSQYAPTIVRFSKKR